MKSFTILFLLALVTIVVSLTSLVSCDNNSDSMHWLQFRGSNALGIASEEANPPIFFSADTNLLWKTEVLPGWSSPCIVNERIFLTGFNETDSLLYTMAINRKDGKILWEKSVTPSGYYNKHPLTTYANATVASDGKYIFVSFPNYGLIAYDLEGNLIWNFQHEVISDFYYEGASSPIVMDSTVIIIVSSEQDQRVIALNTQTGDSVWTIRAPGKEWSHMYCSSTPIIYDKHLIMHLYNIVVSYNLDNREPEWWFLTPTTSVGTPVIMDDVLYLNTWTQGGEKNERGVLLPFSDMLIQYDKNGDRSIQKDELSDDLYFFSRPEIHDVPFSAMQIKREMFFNSFDSNKSQSFEENEWNEIIKFGSSYFVDEHGMLALPLEGTGERHIADLKWKVNKDTPETPSPLVVGENVFFIKDGGTATVIDRKTGEVIFNERIGATGCYLSSPILAGKRIYTCSYNGVVTVISTDDFKIMAHNKLKEKIGASPVAVKNVLYIRTDKNLYAFRD